MDVMKYLKESAYQTAILLSIAIIGMGFPYGFPLFGIMGFAFLCINFMQGKISFKINRYIGLYFAMIIMYIWGLLLNNGLRYQIVKSDLVNILGYIVIYIIFSGMQKDDYKNTIEIFARIIIVSGFILSLVSLYKYYCLLNGIKINFFKSGESYPWGTSLVLDYNMFSYSLVIPLLFVIYKFRDNNNDKIPIGRIILILMLIVTILLSGSRRGLSIIALIVIYLILKGLKTFITINTLRYKLSVIKKLLIVIVLFACIVFALNFIKEDNLLTINNYELEKLIKRASTLKSDNLKESFSQRTDRWRYALDIVSESDVKGILLGTGFDYIDKYTNRNILKIEDHPHMPLLSALLYSGIIGFLVTATTYFIPLLLLTINKRYYGKELLSIYIISLLYFSVSSNSIFSIKILNLLLILIFTQYSNINIKVMLKNVDRAQREESTLQIIHNK